MPAPVLLDVSCLCEEHTNDALEGIFKAIGEGPPDDGIWEPHPNPFVQRLVELFTSRGLTRISSLRQELQNWLAGEHHDPSLSAPATRPAGAMRRWSEAELALSRLYLGALPPGAWTLDDWLMLVDYLVQRYLPEADLRSEADWLATRSNIMGRVQAAMGTITGDEADTLVMAIPDLDTIGREWGMSREEKASIDFGRARCAEHVTGLADATRTRMRKMIVDHQEAVALGDAAGAAESIQSKILDEFGLLNRDWRRIAVTEATENVNQGFVAAQAFGTKLKRVELYRGACPWCKSIHGNVVTVVDPAAPKKNGDTQVWTGKTNVGRSASPMKREGGKLVERGPGEMWWIAAGAQHPHCRGSWVRIGGASPDPEFDAWLENLRKRGKP